FCFYFFFFFFSSRRRHTRWPRDWSSDVCSSDLLSGFAKRLLVAMHAQEVLLEGLDSTFATMRKSGKSEMPPVFFDSLTGRIRRRSEERRVGKECRSRWVADG